MSEKKIAVVTGGSRGIGKAIVERLAKDGMDVYFSYRSGEESATLVEKVCSEYEGSATKIKADVSSTEDCKAFIAKVKELAGNRIDVLVNNAGITKDGLLMRMKDEDFDSVINVNLKGTFVMIREVTPLMLRAGSGSIINISSVSGVLGNAGQANYSASKAGVIGLTKAAARELASKKIKVNAIAPGMIETDMTKNMPEKAQDALKEGIPFKEIGRVEDIAGCVSFLAGDDSRYITGQVICVDGGMAI